jgi:hypothetical protein
MALQVGQLYAGCATFAELAQPPEKVEIIAYLDN